MLHLLILLSLLSFAHSITIGKIANNLMIGYGQVTLMSVSQDQCICAMLQSNTFALNYYNNNNTCTLLSYNGSSILLQSSNNTLFVFINQSSALVKDIKLNGPTSPLIDAFWSFDNTSYDRDFNYNSTLNNASFCPSSITGHGSALCFNASQKQVLSINPNNHLNLSFTSFTFHYWIYLYSTVSNDQGMIGQCQSINLNQCLHLTIRDSKARISFYGNICTGNTTVKNQTWYHLAYVYDYSRATQLVYLNGMLDCIQQGTSTPLAITNPSSIPLTIGYTAPFTRYYFDGVIDHLTLVQWPKNASEILEQATLVAHYDFDDSSIGDHGPSGISSLTSNTTLANNSLLFNSTSSYFQSSAFVLLAIGNRSYSLCLWLKPFRTNNITILHVYQLNQTNSVKWCSIRVSLNQQSQLRVQARSSTGVVTLLGPSIGTNVWTHVVQTYSSINGIQLYINGTFYNKSSSSDYQGGSKPVTIQLGGSLSNGTNGSCFDWTIDDDEYEGWMDEFRVYSREVTSNEVQALSIRT
ncbi:unnamed protein product [Adineta ricciae]|uniref:Uncharacterized protein n=1 Tax=Adineta ricciae TaxID=249248 RepID=A0A815GB12_ADIRI|nr:unnamed protein product [Adineta ricciae]CAF1354551.1 unnamed protein product [Adineta ricciae]